jgi:hypothetical protein
MSLQQVVVCTAQQWMNSCLYHTGSKFLSYLRMLPDVMKQTYLNTYVLHVATCADVTHCRCLAWRSGQAYSFTHTTTGVQSSSGASG